MGEKKRNTGIDILKILAMVLIVASHVVQTMGTTHPGLSVNDNYFFDLNMATTSPSIFTLDIIRYGGALGNNVFFVCTAWFLCSKNSLKINKITRLMLENYLISIFVFACVYFLGYFSITQEDRMLSLFPTLLGSNWYVTCYIIIFLLHPYLNSLCSGLDRRQHKSLCMVLVFLYSILGFLKPNILFPSSVITFTNLYIIVSYVKKYSPAIFDKNNAKKVLAWSLILNTLLITGVNIGGVYISALNDKLMYFDTNQNPLFITSAISMFVIFRDISVSSHFVNKIVGKTASVTLYVYIIHENVIMRRYLRPLLFDWIYDEYGYGDLLLWMVIVTALLFVVSAVIGLIYTRLFDPLFNRISNKIASGIDRIKDRVVG